MGAIRSVESTAGRVPAWLRKTDGENRIGVAVSIIVAIASQMFLPDRLAIGPSYALPSIEIVLFIVLSIGNPIRMRREHKALRIISLVVVALMSFANAVAAATLVSEIARGRAHGGAPSLLATGAEIYVTNIVAFALWYWEFDRGGPFARARGEKPYPDFLFPQMSSPELADPDWEPYFLDYLYVSFTNATAFSPTDTLPMSRWTKTLMALQSGVALVTVAFVLARAVNILNA